MKEKENIKISLSTFFLTLAIILIVILGYFIFNTSKQNTQLADENANLNNKLASLENEKSESKSSTNENNIVQNTITNSTVSNNATENTNNNSNEIKDETSTNEKVAMCNLDDTRFYGYLDNGNLYYAIYDGSTDFGNAPQNKITKYTKLSNIKKINYYNYGTSTAPKLMLLTKESQLYTIDLANTLAKKSNILGNFTLLESTKNFNVTDFKFENTNGNFNLALTLQDGTSKNITLFSYPE